MNSNVFHHQTGLTIAEFDMLFKEFEELVHVKRVGRPRSIAPKIQLQMFLQWMRRGYCYQDLEPMFHVSVSTCFKYIQETLNLLFDSWKDDVCVSQSRIVRLREAVKWRDKLVVMVIDGAEQGIRTYRDNKFFEQSTYSGKKRKHTFSTLLAVTPKTGRIIALSESFNGAHNDAGIYNQVSHVFEQHLWKDECIGGDPAFIGIKHASVIGLKRSRGCQLSVEEEQYNNDWASVRVVVENAIAQVKHWNICRNTLFYVGTPDEGRHFHHMLWLVASVLVNRFSLPRSKQ